jgi:hypothetical protein
MYITSGENICMRVLIFRPSVDGKFLFVLQFRLKKQGALGFAWELLGETLLEGKPTSIRS